MTFLLFLFGIFLALGMFLLTADLLRLPRLATQRAMLSVGRQEKKQARSVEALLMGWAIKLAPHIHMDEYKRGRLKNTLAAAGLNMTPEEYTAFAMIKTGAVLLTVIPCLLIFPMLALIVVLLAVAVYFKEIRRAEEKLSAKRDEIEAELPRFVATITQELAASRDVLSMIEHYKQNSGPVFSAELDVLTADMRSGSYEAALTRFEARFNSPLLSDIVRGLIGVLRGDNGVHYFQMLSHDMKQLELQRLKAKAMKIPPKIRVFSFVLLMCFLVTYDEEWAAEDNKFRSVTSFTASRASLRELRDYLADTLKYARIRAERQIKAGELPGGWFDPKDWDGWQKHMEGLIHRLDGVLALEGSTLELAHPPAPTVPELTM